MLIERETAHEVRGTSVLRRPKPTLCGLRPRTFEARMCLDCMKKGHPPDVLFMQQRARDGTRTRGLDLGKVALHQLSHSRIFYWVVHPTSDTIHYNPINVNYFFYCTISSLFFTLKIRFNDSSILSSEISPSLTASNTALYPVSKFSGISIISAPALMVLTQVSSVV